MFDLANLRIGGWPDNRLSAPAVTMEGRGSIRSPLKKGTGTSRVAVLAGVKGDCLGASPLFQRTASPQPTRAHTDRLYQVTRALVFAYAARKNSVRAAA